MGTKTSALHAFLSFFFPHPPGDNINVTVNNHNNFQTTSQEKPTQKSPKLTHFSSVSVHKGCSLLASIGISYASLYFYLIHLAHALGKSTCWSLWKHDITLKKLQESEDDIPQELLLSIQKNYTSYENPMDFFTPLATFLKDIQKEEHQLRKYLKLFKTVKQLHLSTFFSIDEKIAQNAPSRLERLAYLKNLFLTWAASYKLNYCPSDFSTRSNSGDIKKAVAK